jgi:anti-sigma factor RsiW
MNEQSHVIPNEWLALYYDGELDARRREQVDAHLPACVHCQQELAALKALSSLLVLDRLSEDALASQSARLAWRALEPRLPERAADASSPLRWLPGIGLLMATVLVQFIAVASVVVTLVAGQVTWIAQSMAWLDDTLSGWLLGWLAWLLPAQSSGWGLSLLLVILSAWLGYVSLQRQLPTSQVATLG